MHQTKKGNEWYFGMKAHIGTDADSGLVHSLTGTAANVAENNGAFFTVYLNAAATAGDTVTLAFARLGDKFQAILGDSTVAADGAVITLVDGQTEVRFALVQTGELSADATGALSVRYRGSDQHVTSNSFAINLKDAGEATRTYNGEARVDQVVLLTKMATQNKGNAIAALQTAVNTAHGKTFSITVIQIENAFKEMDQLEWREAA
jgi:hypothetical protein